jgi:hypothetical protein
MASAEQKDFPEAIKWQKNAIEQGKGQVFDQREAMFRLQLYEAGKPFRIDGPKN